MTTKAEHRSKVHAAAFRYIDAMALANRATRDADAALKEAMFAFSEGKFAKPLELTVEGGVVWDVGELVLSEDYVDVDRLVKEVAPIDALRAAGISQKAVKSLKDGEALLKRVLRRRDKPAEFKIKRRKV